jgi:hypothetical protein
MPSIKPGTRTDEAFRVVGRYRHSSRRCPSRPVRASAQEAKAQTLRISPKSENGQKKRYGQRHASGDSEGHRGIDWSARAAGKINVSGKGLEPPHDRKSHRNGLLSNADLSSNGAYGNVIVDGSAELAAILIESRQLKSTLWNGRAK